LRAVCAVQSVVLVRRSAQRASRTAPSEELTMAITESPPCPQWGDWNVRVVHTAPSARGVIDRELISGRCHSCNHEWTDEL